jgi:Flp pilus assembly protein TadG
MICASGSGCLPRHKQSSEETTVYGNRYRSEPHSAMGIARLRKPAQALVEIALILPLIMLLMLGVFDFTRVYVIGVALQGAAREGARMAADYNKSTSDVQARVIAAASPVTVTTSDIRICVNATPQANPQSACPVPGSNATRTSSNAGHAVIVTVRVTVSLISSFVTSYVGLSDIPVSASVQMIIL